MLLKKIKVLCTEFGISITALEKECGLSKGAIHRWGEVSPSVNNLRKVADHFCVSLDYLVAEEEMPADGRLTIYRDEEAVVGCEFHTMRKLTELIEMFVKGNDVRVEIHTHRTAEMGQEVSYSAK